MDATRLKQIEEIYHAAVEIPLDERESFFKISCGEDENLRREVKSLLSFENTFDSIIDAPLKSLAAEMFSEPKTRANPINTEIGHYRIKQLLGRGGMGEVYLAEDLKLNRRVALKLIPADLTDNKHRLKRFEQEAQAVSALNHPNILTIHEFGEENDSHFIVMEFVGGETLGKKMKGDEPLSISEILKIAAQVASALSAAHGAGIVHRDIKPDNIMLRDDGLVKVLDFGIAKLTGMHGDIHSTDSEANTRAFVETNPGALLGTVDYMSPEQARGKAVDARSDIFSFGVVLYEMLSGKKPFTGDSPVEVMGAIIKDEPPALGEANEKISPALQKLVGICLEKKSERRFHSAHDLGFALETLSTTTSGLSLERAYPSISSKRRKIIIRERFAWLLAAAFAAVAVAGFYYAWQMRGAIPKQRAFRQLNFRTEEIFQAGFAPDGKTVVYSAAVEGNTPELFTIHPDFPAPQSIGVRGTHLLDVSSKGELAILMDAKYLRHRTFVGTLARMPLVGGAPRQILEGVRHAAWSPDGSQLAVIREVEGKDRLEYPIGKTLYEVSGNLSDARVSPDGKRVAFFEHPQKNDDRGSVNVVDLDGKKTMLSDGYWSERGLGWSPDGAEVLFSASLSGGNYMIFAVTLDGSRRIADQSPGGLLLQAVAPDGRWLVNRIDFRYAAMVHTPGTEDDRNLSWLRTSHSKVLSQDGQTLLFLETSAGKDYATCLRKTDGSPLVRLGEGTPTDLSPDGKSVLAIVPSKPPQLVAYPTGAGETQQFDPSDIESYASAQWFRDGGKILVGGNESGKGTRFYVQEIGGSPRAVTPEGVRDGRLSPDGKFILARGNEGKYFLYPTGGGDARPVEWLTDADVVIGWSADNRFWFVYRGLTVPCRVERVNVETGRRELFKEIAPPNRTGILSVRPNFITDNQQSYAYTTYQQVSSLFVTEENE